MTSILTSKQRKRNIPKVLIIPYEICRVLINMFCAVFIVFLYINIASTWFLSHIPNGMIYGILWIGYLFTSFWICFRALSIDYIWKFEYFKDSFLDILKKEKKVSKK